MEVESVSGSGHAPPLEWDYNYEDDSSEWGINFPDANGESQSPIDINSREAVYDENFGGSPLNFSYALCRETDICNNGHTLVVYLKYKPGDGFRNDPSGSPKSILSGGPLPPGSEYELTEFRFHWGKENSRGSEHTVNFKAFPMELHLIHYNIKKYGSLEEALGKVDGVVIVGLFIMVGREHSGLKQLTEQLEDVKHKGRQKTITTPFNPMCLLPDPMLRDYWAYSGSLTSPPCCENVTWVLLRYPLTVSLPQLDEFRRLKTYPQPDDELAETPAEGALVDNFRPTQPLNDRVIKASFPQ